MPESVQPDLFRGLRCSEPRCIRDDAHGFPSMVVHWDGRWQWFDDAQDRARKAVRNPEWEAWETERPAHS